LSIGWKATSDTILKAHCHGFDVHFVYRATQLVTIAFSETTVFSAGSFNGTVARVLPNGHDSSTISFSFSGASSIDFNSGLVVAHGPTLFAGPDDPTTAEWEGALFLASGNTVADPANGTFLSSTRPVRDLCAELAAA